MENHSPITCPNIDGDIQEPKPLGTYRCYLLGKFSSIHNNNSKASTHAMASGSRFAQGMEGR